MTVTGRVEREDLGAGVQVLVTDDGRRFALRAREPLPEGRAVEVDGRLAEDAVGIGMTGDPVLEVDRVRPV
ncbi:MAG: hypothetical protein M9894_11655 [Planctomycetes bacterium]|nr:hypothetical protein [Planctomycetota bacterium]